MQEVIYVSLRQARSTIVHLSAGEKGYFNQSENPLQILVKEVALIICPCSLASLLFAMAFIKILCMQPL